MEFTYLSLLGAFIMLVIGLVGYTLLYRLLYPVMRERHERAKVTGKHGADPAFTWGVIRFVALVILPVCGFVFGNPVLTDVIW